MKPSLICALLALTLFSRCDSDDDAPSNGSKLHVVTMYLQNQQGAFRPGFTNTYFYSPGGRLEREEYASYDTEKKEFELLWTVTFSYQDNRVSETKKVFTQGGDPDYVRYTYGANGKLSAMDVQEDVHTVATVTYDASDTTSVFYQHSNGRSFTYRFFTKNGNITYEQTLNDSHQLSGETTYEFDSHTNPYSQLGYTDVFFTNFSQNNKTSTVGKYYSDAFPNSVPDTYEYTYNTAGLPTQQTIHYKSYPNGNPSGAIHYTFEYY